MGFGKKDEEVNGNIVKNGKEEKTLLEKEEDDMDDKGGGVGHVKDGLDQFVPPDGGWGWVVCVMSFWCNGTIFGILNTFGILMVKMLEEYDNGDADLVFKTSWIGALQISMTFFMSPVASISVDRFGIRPTAFAGALLATTGMLASSFVKSIEVMYITYGLFLGIGSSLIYNPSLVILGHYFKKHLGIVNGLVSFGSAIFTIILPFLLKYTLSTIGLFNTFRMLAGFLALLMVGSITWRPLYETRHTELDKYLSKDGGSKGKCGQFTSWASKFLNVHIWKNKGYRVWAVALPVAFLGYFIPFVHLVNHTRLKIPDADGESLVMCIGVTSGVSRLIFGKVADLPKVNRIRMQQFAFLVLGVVTACIPLASEFWALIVITLVMGISDGCFICLLGPIAFDLLGPAGAAQGLGCLLGIASLPMTAGPPLAGLAYDYMGTYDIAFYAAGIPPILSAILLFLIPAPKKNKAQPAVSMTKTYVAMSMENLDKIDANDYLDDDLPLPFRKFRSRGDSLDMRIGMDLKPKPQQSIEGRLFHSTPHLAGPPSHISYSSSTHPISPLALSDTPSSALLDPSEDHSNV